MPPAKKIASKQPAHPARRICGDALNLTMKRGGRSLMPGDA